MLLHGKPRPINRFTDPSAEIGPGRTGRVRPVIVNNVETVFRRVLRTSIPCEGREQAKLGGGYAQGRLVELAGAAELFARPKHPYTLALLASVLTPEPGLGIPETGLGLAFPNPLDPPAGCPFHPRCPDRIAVCRLQRPPLARTESGLAACHVHAPNPEAAAA